MSDGTTGTISRSNGEWQLYTLDDSQESGPYGAGFTAVFDPLSAA